MHTRTRNHKIVIMLSTEQLLIADVELVWGPCLGGDVPFCLADGICI